MIDAVVVGAGQYGLAASWHLSRRGIEHVVIERGQVAETWRSQRWDSFALNTPNWMNRLAGETEAVEPRGRLPHARGLDRPAGGPCPTYAGADPDRDDGHRRRHGSNAWHLPGLRRRSRRSRHHRDAPRGHRLGRPVGRTPTGALREPAADVLQLHTSEYRSPRALPEGPCSSSAAPRAASRSPRTSSGPAGRPTSLRAPSRACGGGTGVATPSSGSSSAASTTRPWSSSPIRGWPRPRSRRSRVSAAMGTRSACSRSPTLASGCWAGRSRWMAPGSSSTTRSARTSPPATGAPRC